MKAHNSAICPFPLDTPQAKYRWQSAQLTAASQKRRARKLGASGSFTALQWLNLCLQFDFRCLCCGRRDLLDADHINPLSKGGSNDISNIQPLCDRCNTIKKDRHIDYRSTPFVNALPTNPQRNPVRFVRGAHGISRGLMALLLGIDEQVVKDCEVCCDWPNVPDADRKLSHLAMEVGFDIGEPFSSGLR